MSVDAPDKGLLPTRSEGRRRALSQVVSESVPAGRRLICGDWCGLLVLFVVSTALSAAYAWGSLAHPTAARPGDAQTVTWFLSWVQFAVFHGHGGFVTNYGQYPAGANLMWNNPIYLAAVLMSPVTALAGPAVSYNLLFVAAPVVAACTSYLLFIRYLKTRLGAMVGALAFGFSPFMILHQHGHQQLTLLGLVPLTLIVLDEILVRQRWQWWVAGGTLGLLAAAQLLTGEEVLAIIGLLGTVLVVVAAILHPRQIARNAGYGLRAVAVAVVVFLALVSYPLYVQYAGPQRSLEVHGASAFSIDLVNFIQPVGEFFDPRLFWNLPVAAEPTGYLGIPLLVAVAVAVALTVRRRPIVPIAFVAFLVFVALSLGPVLTINGHGHGPWVWRLFELGPLKSLLPGRLTLVVDLFAAFFLGLFVDVAVARGPKRGRAFGAALLVVVLLSWVPAPGGPGSTIQVPRFFTSSDKRVIPQGAVALVLPYVGGPFTEMASVWQAASDMRFRMVDGWFIVPGSHSGPSTVMSQTMIRLKKAPVALTPPIAAAVRADLAQDKVQVVIVGPGSGQANTETFFTRFFGRAPDVRSGGVALWWVKSPAQRRSTT